MIKAMFCSGLLIKYTNLKCISAPTNVKSFLRSMRQRSDSDAFILYFLCLDVSVSMLVTFKEFFWRKQYNAYLLSFSTLVIELEVIQHY